MLYFAQLKVTLSEVQQPKPKWIRSHDFFRKTESGAGPGVQFHD